MTRVYRDLRPFPLDDAIKALSGAVPLARVITMGVEQWDAMLAAAYKSGWILLEMDGEVPVRAYRRDE